MFNFTFLQSQSVNTEQELFKIDWEVETMNLRCRLGNNCIQVKTDDVRSESTKSCESRRELHLRFREYQPSAARAERVNQVKREGILNSHCAGLHCPMFPRLGKTEMSR